HHRIRRGFRFASRSPPGHACRTSCRHSSDRPPKCRVGRPAPLARQTGAARHKPRHSQRRLPESTWTSWLHPTPGRRGPTRSFAWSAARDTHDGFAFFILQAENRADGRACSRRGQSDIDLGAVLERRFRTLPAPAPLNQLRRIRIEFTAPVHDVPLFIGHIEVELRVWIRVPEFGHGSFEGYGLGCIIRYPGAVVSECRRPYQGERNG